MSTEDFKWTDELILEFVRWTTTASPTFQGRYADLEQFKQSKTIHKKEKEYEILTMVNDKIGIHYHNWECGASSDNCKINSVKRLSDNELFELHKTRVTYPNTNHKWVISEITEKGSSLYFNGVNITHVQKVEDKVPILTENVSINDVPCLSVNDVMDFYRKHYEKTKEYHLSHGTVRDGLILLSKQKLNTIKVK